ncbi:MAG: transcription termination/antitermination protein NusA [Alphaproteobacteria bacterium]|nr:transcription termination/antitermination protein NusA [Alphaproteobacteria bacterium]NCQ87921.1 transcription termination/antitermination protein NusA [Alphaproteobacteria bacterium]NCT05572.1 transcription termination/antitermination protein NusA [Alphaproteobacteria bacterium]
MEMLQVADAVAREKNIDQEIVIGAMEEAIQKAGRSKYGHDHDIRAKIDRKNGSIALKRYREIVATEDDIEDETCQITVAQAQREKKDAVAGEFLIDDLPPLDFGRIAAQTAKQVIVQKVREAERARQYMEFKDRTGEIINGIVKRVEYGNVTVDIAGRAEGYMRREETINREPFKVGDRVRAYIYEVREEMRGPQIFVSRTHPEFMAKLFTQEVPEIYEGMIEIKAVARDPGSRAKISVQSRDSSIDPVGACVGMRGSRVQAVVNELQGEKVDIIPWTEDLGSFIISALSPAEVTKVVLNEEDKRIDVVVPEEQLSLAIGRRGQNVRLASMLVGWDIDIMTEAEESKKRAEEFETRSVLFINALDIDEVIAHLLIAEGFASVRELAETPIDELTQIDAFDDDIAAELVNRAIAWIEEQQNILQEKSVELGINADLINFEGLEADVILKLGENDVKSRDDLADLATDELLEILGEGSMTSAEAEALIMRAREHWFAEEAAQVAAAQNDNTGEETAAKPAGSEAAQNA